MGPSPDTRSHDGCSPNLSPVTWLRGGSEATVPSLAVSATPATGPKYFRFRQRCSTAALVVRCAQRSRRLLCGRRRIRRRWCRVGEDRE